MTHSQADTHHVADLLPAYLNKTLDKTLTQMVDKHLADCASCQTQLQAWAATAGAAQLALSTAPLPALTLLDSVWARIDTPEPVATPQRPRIPALVGYLWRVTRWQARLLHPAIWLVTPLAIIGATTYIALALDKSQGAHFLAFLLPFIAAMGLAFISEPKIAHDMEITLATPTSPRLVVLIRCALILGYVLVLGMGATVTLAHLSGAGVGALAGLWLGPLAVLSSVSVLCALLIGPPVAVAMAAALWIARLARFGTDVGFSPSHDAFWQTNPVALTLAIALFTLAITVAPQRRNWRDEGWQDMA